VFYKGNVTLVIPYSSNIGIIYFSLLPVNLFYLLCIKCKLLKKKQLVITFFYLRSSDIVTSY